MDDVFARIGLALKHLVHVAPVNDPEREEVQRLATELQAFEGTINELIDQRVQARIDAISGGYGASLDALTQRVVALETGVAGIADELDPPTSIGSTDITPAEPAPVVEEAPAPEAGSEPLVAPEDMPNKPAIADAIVAEGGEVPATDASRADLEAALHDVRGTSPDSLTGGGGEDTITA